MKAFTEPLKELGEFESIRESLKKKNASISYRIYYMP